MTTPKPADGHNAERITEGSKLLSNERASDIAHWSELQRFADYSINVLTPDTNEKVRNDLGAVKHPSSIV
jgi:hypothetical protein